jgi:Domain of unknown function (DUF1924)
MWVKETPHDPHEIDTLRPAQRPDRFDLRRPQHGGFSTGCHAGRCTGRLSRGGGQRAAGGAARPATLPTNHGHEWSCASCHGVVPTRSGKHAATGKPIAPLAPAFNAVRFTEAAKTEKWFRRNCNDVMGRECTAAEKADVLSWLLSLKP